MDRTSNLGRKTVAGAWGWCLHHLRGPHLAVARTTARLGVLLLLTLCTGCTSWHEYVRNGFKLGVTCQALQIVFERIDQMKKVELQASRPEVIDFLDPFLPPTLIVLALQVLVLFGLRFTPW